jgi:hypothetical protein
MKFQEIIFIFALLTAVIAKAEPPWTVDDPGITEHEKVILYFAFLSEQSKLGYRTESLPSLAVTLGLSSSTELGMSLPFMNSHAAFVRTS